MAPAVAFAEKATLTWVAGRISSIHGTIAAEHSACRRRKSNENGSPDTYDHPHSAINVALAAMTRSPMRRMNWCSEERRPARPSHDDGPSAVVRVSADAAVFGPSLMAATRILASTRDGFDDMRDARAQYAPVEAGGCRPARRRAETRP